MKRVITRLFVSLPVLCLWRGTSKGEDICIAASNGAAASVGESLLQSRHVLQPSLAAAEAEPPRPATGPAPSNRSSASHAAPVTLSQVPYAVPAASNSSSASHAAPVTLSQVPLAPRLPRVIRSSRNRTTLFYHVHIPKTGGTVVANLLWSDICAPLEDNITYAGWESHCGKTCDMGLTDNELSCADPDRNNVEHNACALNVHRAEALKAKAGAKNIVYVTTLRRGSERLVSQWLHEIHTGLFVPPTGVPPVSNESLQLYIIGGNHSGAGWLGRKSPTLRNNLQIGQLASKYTTLDSVAAVTREDLKMAKQALTMGQWIIGFTKCMDKVQERLVLYAKHVHGYCKHKAVPANVEGTSNIVLDPATTAMLDSNCLLDNELFDWAWEQAERREDPRFAGTC